MTDGEGAVSLDKKFSRVLAFTDAFQRYIESNSRETFGAFDDDSNDLRFLDAFLFLCDLYSSEGKVLSDDILRNPLFVRSYQDSLVKYTENR